MSTETKHVFKVGDKVSWTHSSSNGTSMRFQTREGKIHSLNGSMAVCKMRNGKTFWVALDRLTPHGQTTELTKMFQPEPDSPASTLNPQSSQL